MNPGRMRFLVNIQRETRVADGYGGFTTTWYTVFDNIFADITQPSGSDVFKFGKMLEKIQTKIVIRYNKAIKNGWRVKYGDTSYSVKYAIDEDMRHKYTILFCEEVI